MSINPLNKKTQIRLQMSLYHLVLHLLPIHHPFVHELGEAQSVKNHHYSAVLLLEDALRAFFVQLRMLSKR